MTTFHQTCGDFVETVVIYVSMLFNDSNSMLFNNGRLDNLILDSIIRLKEPKGSDRAAIAAYIEVFILQFLHLRFIQSKHLNKQMMIKMLLHVKFNAPTII